MTSVYQYQRLQRKQLPLFLRRAPVDFLFLIIKMDGRRGFLTMMDWDYIFFVFSALMRARTIAHERSSQITECDTHKNLFLFRDEFFFEIVREFGNTRTREDELLQLKKLVREDFMNYMSRPQTAKFLVGGPERTHDLS